MVGLFKYLVPHIEECKFLHGSFAKDQKLAEILSFDIVSAWGSNEDLLMYTKGNTSFVNITMVVCLRSY